MCKHCRQSGLKISNDVSLPFQYFIVFHAKFNQVKFVVVSHSVTRINLMKIRQTNQGQTAVYLSVKNSWQICSELFMYATISCHKQVGFE